MEWLCRRFRTTTNISLPLSHCYERSSSARRRLYGDDDVDDTHDDYDDDDDIDDNDNIDDSDDDAGYDAGDDGGCKLH